MTPAIRPLTITPLLAKNGTKTICARGIGIQFQLVRGTPHLRKKKGTAVKTGEEILPNQQILFHFLRELNALVTGNPPPHPGETWGIR